MRRSRVGGVAKMLGHPTRVAILKYLGDGEASVAALAQQLDLLSNDVRYHLKVLEKAGWVEVARREKARGSDKQFFCLAFETLAGQADGPVMESFVLDAMETLEASRADAALGPEESGGDENRGRSQIDPPLAQRITIPLDQTARVQVHEVIEVAIRQLRIVRAQSRDRLRTTGASNIPSMSVGVMAFEVRPSEGCSR